MHRWRRRIFIRIKVGLIELPAESCQKICTLHKFEFKIAVWPQLKWCAPIGALHLVHQPNQHQLQIIAGGSHPRAVWVSKSKKSGRNPKKCRKKSKNFSVHLAQVPTSANRKLRPVAKWWFVFGHLPTSVDRSRWTWHHVGNNWKLLPTSNWLLQASHYPWVGKVFIFLWKLIQGVFLLALGK